MIEIVNNANGCVANHAAANRLIITKGPSVNIGAAAVHAPALSPPESVSLITIVSNGPGFIPSTKPSVIPAKVNPNIRSISILSSSRSQFGKKVEDLDV